MKDFLKNLTKTLSKSNRHYFLILGLMYSFVVNAEFQSVPNAPFGLNATALSSKAVRLEWTDNSNDETGFRIERSFKQDSDFEAFAILSPNSTYVVDHGRFADSTYFYRIVAINETGDSDYSETASVTTGSNELELPYYFENTDIGSPNVPGNATFENGFFFLKGNGFMNDNLNNAHYMYQTLRGDGEIVGQITRMTTAHGAHHGVVIRESLEPEADNVMAEYKGRKTPVFRGRKNGAYFTHEVDEIDFQVPFWLRMQRIGNEFIGYFSENGQDWQEIHREVVPMGTDVLIGLLTHADRDNNNSGNATWRDVEAAQSYIGAPTAFTAIPSVSDEIVLNWQDNADNESGFRIERSIKGEDIWKDLVEVGPDVTTFIDDGLIPAATYAYRVRAIDGTAASFPSDEQTAEVLEVPNAIFFMERKIGDTDRTSNNNTINVTKTADTIKNILRYPGMNGKQVDVTLGTSISSLNGALSFKIMPYTQQQTMEFFSSDFLQISQVEDQLLIDANSTENVYDVVLDSVTCNHVVLNFNNGVMTPYINGQFYEAVSVGNFDMGSFSLQEFNGNLWDVLITSGPMSEEVIFSQSDRCVNGVQVAEPRFSDRPISMCGVYSCLWEGNPSDLQNEKKRAR